MPDEFVDFDDVYELDSVDDFNLDESESPYFDWDNDRMFDEPTRKLIDRIANDPRFDYASAAELVDELAPDLGEDERRCLRRAAQEVFDLTVFPGLEATAQQLVAKTLADPNWDALRAWNGESSDDIDDALEPYSDLDPRIRTVFTRQLATSDIYQRRQEEARAGAENEARQILGELPRRTRDLLVLANRNADRECLLEPWTEGASQRRRSLISYYAQRIEREKDENAVLDRYSAAAKILFHRGSSKKAIADALEMGVGRIDRLLERTSGQDIADDDPLCDLVPELRGIGDGWQRVGLVHANKSRPFSRLSVAEKVTLADQSCDNELLVRLAKQGSRRISEALLTRHRQRGDIGEDILKVLYSSSSWMLSEFIDANSHRPMPQAIVLALADKDARLLLDCDEATALAAKSIGRPDFDAVLAVRETDIDALEHILAAYPQSKSFSPLVDLLIERPMTNEMLGSRRLLTSLLHTAEHTSDSELRTVLRLIACQSPEVLSEHVAAVNNREGSLSPQAVVAVALGEYHLSGRSSREGVRESARALWEAADFTTEHSRARKIVVERGSEVVSIETANNVYVATADAIRSYRNSETTEYTYVHLRSGSGHPALGYHRENRKHPLYPDGPEVQAIVWPIPFQPAIYSLDIGLGESAGLIAVSGDRVAVVQNR
ncbi:hypothetical protein H7J08_19065 [Mycobacterium frederiksbergense]|uniref:hypothetical protein n=1 Tax=Mycolicibacterium frederiksbergense TaxID=117567 RepID=UPI0021F3BBE5|nr:hypothetical protein [Mycolicibacterium frederiksbergense]MCV7046751.1 hypothetical protein [Mycolicibacterium frederiksbergense]